VDKALLKVEEAAAYVSLGRSKFYELLGTKAIPVVRIGRAVRVPTSALQRWVEEQTEAAREGEP
jgi:excisionase family DNA binding protein